MQPMRSLVVVGLAALVGVACRAQGAGEQAARTGDVAMFRGDAAHTGVSASPPIVAYGGLQWRFATDGPVQGTPAVTADAVYVGGVDGRLYALDRVTGVPRWKYDAGSPIASSVAVAEGLVFVATRDRRLRAVDARSGRERWRFEFAADVPMPWGYESGDFWLSSPTYDRGAIYVGAGDGRLYALRAADGDVHWSLATDGRIRSTPAVDGGHVFVGTAGGTMYAVDAASGRLAWRFETEGHQLRSADWGFDRRTIQSSPAVGAGLVVFGSRDGGLYAVDRETGALRWRADHDGSWVNSSPALAHGLAFAGSSDGRFVQAVELRTGVERWRVPLGTLVWASPAVAGDLVYFADWQGGVVALEAKTGARRWRAQLAGRLLASPVVDDGQIVIGSDDGGVYALNGAPAVRALRRAVFWDSALAARSPVTGHARIRAFLTARGYDSLAAPSLVSWLESRVRDRVPNVVVFAVDELPPALEQAADTALLRRYLDAGGKVAWLGVPPLIWPRDSAGGRVYAAVDRRRTARLLDVDHTVSNFDPRASRVTAAGRRWGLDGWWNANWAVAPSAVTEVLAVNDEGAATAWARRYGGPPGSGFVRLPAVGWGDAPSVAQLAMLQAAAEHFPRER